MAESTAKLASEAIELMQLATPDPVAMWPQTPAWYGVFALILALGLLLLWRQYHTYRCTLWRRQALLLAEQAREVGRAQPWFQLLKRVHLVHHSRQAVSELTDQQLLAVLPGLEPSTQLALQQAHYRQDSTLSEEANTALYRASVTWIASLPGVQPRVEPTATANDITGQGA